MRRKPSDLNRDTMLGGFAGMLSGGTFARARPGQLVAFGAALGLSRFRRRHARLAGHGRSATTIPPVRPGRGR
jgi:hypothetical protein